MDHGMAFATAGRLEATSGGDALNMTIFTATTATATTERNEAWVHAQFRGRNQES